MSHLRFALALALALLTTGCAGDIKSFIVRTRNQQGDASFAHKNPLEAAQSYKLALRVDPANQHARAGLAAVQLQLAVESFVDSRFDDALAALNVAAQYDPQSVRLAELRAEIEQARIQRSIVLANYPTYRETGLALRRSYAQLHVQSNAVVSSLQRFNYTFDANELTRAIQQSHLLATDVARLSSRLAAYRQVVESGAPEKGTPETLAPAASLLPLP